ncbi:MAG: Low molecular weight protein-tyrosine-phosphatase YwlE [Planctomycetota bacterium]|jgi:protein-tyrosine phosphatase
MSERRRTLTADRAAEHVAAATTLLRAGANCVIPTETGYALAAAATDAAAVARAAALVDQPSEAAALSFADHTAVVAACGPLPERLRRLAERYWPGPLALAWRAPSGTECRAGVPGHEFPRALAQALGGSLALFALHRADGPAVVGAEEVERLPALTAVTIFDGGKAPLGDAGAAVRLDGDRLLVEREGILSAVELLEAAAEHVLFVCTGNTCRSPLAEVLARDLVARRLGVRSDEVLARGWSFGSAGTHTCDGMPASENGVLAAHEVDLDLTGHASRELDRALVARADRIYCLSRSHRQALLAAAPQAAPKVELLRPDGRDVADPYGGDLDEYRHTRDDIRAALGKRIAEWLQ